MAARKSASVSSLLASCSSQPSQPVKSKTATRGRFGSMPRYFMPVRPHQIASLRFITVQKSNTGPSMQV